MQSIQKIVLLLLFIGIFYNGDAQTADTAIARKIYESKDTITAPAEPNPTFKETDSTKLKNPNARKPSAAALRSAILPGWGQVYNKKIWKVPIVYAGLGITAGLFVDNLKWYKRFRYAYVIIDKIQKGEDSIGSASYAKVNDQLKKYAFVGQNGLQPEILRNGRDEYRQNVDYSAVFFALAWLLNVVDATVDAHLSTFDISPNLSFKMEPGYSEMANTSGLSFVLKIK